MIRVQVHLGARSYPIDIGRGTLSRVGKLLKSLGAGRRVAVVTDSHVGLLYAGAVTEALNAAGFASRVFAVAAGERSKSVAALKKLWDGFVALDMDRDSTVVALGGGVVGDLAGFAAATYMRGIRCVQVPTTMLACVDSSVGGKTAIDLASGKNLVGAFHQPQAVLIDPSVLRTLPKRELRAGLVEVIKSGVIMDAAFFRWTEANIARLLRLGPAATVKAIRRCCELKAMIVGRDEQESDRRAVLNYGHTVGHALEALARYEDLIHGEAVAVGMIVASRVAEKLGMVAPDVTARQKALLERTGLSTAVKGPATSRILDTMRHDKKARGGKLTMVLPTRIGKVKVVRDVSAEVVREALEESRGA
jgi:3-dehydroquinate synthase